MDTKSAEYRNVSKEEFKHLQNQEEFIETATFEKNKLGVSKSEIKAVIDSGKMAVLVLQPEVIYYYIISVILQYLEFTNYTRNKFFSIRHLC